MGRGQEWECSLQREGEFFLLLSIELFQPTRGSPNPHLIMEPLYMHKWGCSWVLPPDQPGACEP